MSEKNYKLVRNLELIAFLILALVAAYGLVITKAPDEAMRYLIPQYIFNHGKLPVGTEPEVINQIWGFSYALYPYLTSQISVVFMKIASVFTASPLVLLFAARLTSVLSGFGTMIFAFKAGKLFFRENEFALLFGTFVGFVPQFIFLCSYQNNDCFAVFCSAIIIYCWAYALKNGWSMKVCLGLGIGCGLCMLSYYSAYIYCLASLILYFVNRAMKKEKGSDILLKALFIIIIAFLIAGWFFVRNYLIHNGDFLGRRTLNELAEQFAMEGFKPSQLANPANMGFTFKQTFISLYPGQVLRWPVIVIYSFFGCFGYMEHWLVKPIYFLYLILVAVPAVIFIVYMIARGKKEKPFFISGKLTLLMILLIFMNLGLFMYMVYYSDWQGQGRYMMPSLLPVMLMATGGIRAIAGKKADNKPNGSVLAKVIIVVYFALCVFNYVRYFAPNCLQF